jgi:hypothetical protein
MIPILGMPMDYHELHTRQVATTKWLADFGRPATIEEITSFKPSTLHVATVEWDGKYFHVDGHPSIDPTKEGLPCKVP